MSQAVGDLLAIRFSSTTKQVTLVIRDGDNLYGVLGVRGAHLDLDSYDVLAEYGRINYAYHSQFDTITLNQTELTPKLQRYYLDFPIPAHSGEYLDEETGWLSPDGVLYPCPYAQHISAAEHILVSRCGRTGTDETLEGLGWIRLLRDGSAMWPRVNHSIPNLHLTQSQIDTLFDMLMAAKSELRKRGLTEALSDALGEQRVASALLETQALAEIVETDIAL